MEPQSGPGARSSPTADETALDSVQFGEDIRHLISVPTENASSFTALLELPPNQAVELLHSPESTRPDSSQQQQYQPPQHFNAGLLTFPTNAALIERAAKFSVFAAEEDLNNNNNGIASPETNSAPSNSSAGLVVKTEPAEPVAYLNSSSVASDPTVATKDENQRPNNKRKEREKKGKGSSKKSKSAANENSEQLPYVHVRARRGQATDSHSLAERARREKINARMKLLQELVPGCNKISGTALVLDEIINHVQSLQRQVEVLSMKLAAVNPRIDFNLDNMLAAESGSLMDSNFPAVMMPIMWPEVQPNGSRQQYHQQQWNFDVVPQPAGGGWGREDGHNFITPENSLLSYVSSANSASLNSSQLKMEL
ncbi:unnamed protein product [Linum tenue]|uniref:BHLH domain-containing protein n=1 Tax=Linum tenue TaxID=586396 RepID=A0AAV0GXN4_9ROSI|nr:unnamed protein product [Linum tenue]